MSHPFYKLQCIQCKQSLNSTVCSCGAKYTMNGVIFEAVFTEESTAFTEGQTRQLESMECFHFWTKARTQWILNQLDLFFSLNKNQRILDVGCGTGNLVEELTNKGYQVVGIDLQKEGLLRQKIKKPSLHFLRACAKALPFPDGQFEVVIFADVLEHMEERRPLQEAFRVLAPGGILLITVPAFPRLWSRRDIDAGHLRRYLPKDLQMLANNLGGQMVYLGFYQFFLFPLVLISRLFNILPSKEVTISRYLNQLFLQINLFEVWAGKWIRWPWGSSLLGIVKK
jgi:ubiquinone/menaquinone biosynthesis C-methylase UbiE